MTDNNPLSPKENGAGADQPSTKEQDIAAAINAAINALEAKYESAQADNSKHNDQVLLWTKRAAKGVFTYTILTVAIVGASIWQGWVSDRTLKQSQRPWVMAYSVKLLKPLDLKAASFSAFVEFDLQNQGVSIATDGWMFAYIEPNDTTILTKYWNETCEMLNAYKQQATLADQKSGFGNWPIGFVLAPNQSTKIQIGMGSHEWSGPAVIDTQERGAGAFYMLGCIKYQDQFRREHTTRTCFQPAGSIGGDGMVTFKICNAFQTAD